MPISGHEQKMLNLQHQMKENHSDLQNFLADLDSWEKDIKKKEEQLTAQSLGKPSPEALPPVRNTIHKKKLKKKKKENSVDPSKPKKISGFDFRAWDKFDVDKALDEIDKEEEKKTSSSEYETDEEWEIERKKHLAGAEKEKGNSFFKVGEYDKAVEAYSKGISFDSTSAVLPANRAMALLKQQKYAAAEIDCTSSISLDPMYVKAYLRRANARVGLGKIGEAIIDYSRVLDLEPSNKMAKTEIERLQKEKDRDLKEPAPQSTLTEGNQGIVKPIYKPPEERSKVPMRRVPIEEIGLEKPKPVQAPVNQSECSKKIKEQESEKFDALFSAAAGKRQPLILEEVSSPSTNTSDSRKPEVSQSAAHIVTNASTQNNSNCTSNIKENKVNGEQTNASKILKTEPEKSSVHDNEKVVVDSGPQREFHIPQSSYQFQTGYKLLKNKPEEFYNYLLRIPPDQFPKLFGQFLDADILTRILKAFHDFSKSSDISIYNTLVGLTEVKRFSMTAMFLSQKEKQVAKDLIQKLSQAGVCSEADLSNLKKKYDL